MFIRTPSAGRGVGCALVFLSFCPDTNPSWLGFCVSSSAKGGMLKIVRGRIGKAMDASICVGRSIGLGTAGYFTSLLPVFFYVLYYNLLRISATLALLL
jgi:hypothetical protein